MCAVVNALSLKKWIVKRQNQQLDATGGVDEIDFIDNHEPSFHTHHEPTVFSQQSAEINEKILAMYT